MTDYAFHNFTKGPKLLHNRFIRLQMLQYLLEPDALRSGYTECATYILNKLKQRRFGTSPMLAGVTPQTDRKACRALLKRLADPETGSSPLSSVDKRLLETMAISLRTVLLKMTEPTYDAAAPLVEHPPRFAERYLAALSNDERIKTLGGFYRLKALNGDIVGILPIPRGHLDAHDRLHHAWWAEVAMACKAAFPGFDAEPNSPSNLNNDGVIAVLHS